MVRYIIRGFFATDGSLVLTDNNGILYPRIEANGISKNLLFEINNFLNLKGINCKCYNAKRLKENGFGYPLNRKEQYRLQINGKKNLKKFEKIIGFINPKQIEKLKGYYGCTKS